MYSQLFLVQKRSMFLTQLPPQHRKDQQTSTPASVGHPWYSLFIFTCPLCPHQNHLVGTLGTDQGAWILGSQESGQGPGRATNHGAFRKLSGVRNHRKHPHKTYPFQCTFGSRAENIREWSICPIMPYHLHDLWVYHYLLLHAHINIPGIPAYPKKNSFLASPFLLYEGSFAKPPTFTARHGASSHRTPSVNVRQSSTSTPKKKRTGGPWDDRSHRSHRSLVLCDVF